MATVTPEDVVAGLRGGGITTLDGLRARVERRVGGVEPEALTWALDDAVQAGWVVRNVPEDCGPDGICGTNPPVTVTISPEGRAVLDRATT